MMMYDAFQIGSFTIQYFLVVVLITFLATYYFIESFLKESDIKHFIRKHYWTVVFILFVSFKFSIVLFRPELLLTNSWIFLTGGQNGIQLGMVISIIYLLWRMKKEKFTTKVFIKSMILTTISFIALYQLIKIVFLSFV
jgi:hypothetical protein